MVMRKSFKGAIIAGNNFLVPKEAGRRTGRLGMESGQEGGKF